MAWRTIQLMQRDPRGADHVVYIGVVEGEGDAAVERFRARRWAFDYATLGEKRYPVRELAVKDVVWFLAGIAQAGQTWPPLNGRAKAEKMAASVGMTIGPHRRQARWR